MVDDIQRGFEKDLFDEYYKFMDRFYALLSLIFATAGFTFTVINLTLGKQVTIQEAVSNYHISLCFCFILLAFLISVINVLSISHHKKLLLRGGAIGLREDDELVKNNIKLHYDIIKQKDYYIIAISSIGFSLISLYSYFAKYRATTAIMVIGIFLMLVISIRKSHHNEIT
jgi:hypothetical protein